MSCERYTGAIVDHACGAEMADELAQHLAGCEACAARLAAERRTIAGLDEEIQGALQVEVSESFERGVHARVAAASRRSVGIWWSVASLGVAASLLVVASLGRPSRELPHQHQTPAPREELVRAPAPPVETPSSPSVGPRKPVARLRTVTTLPPAEVIVPPDHARAVSEYLRLVRDRGFEAPNLEAGSEAAAGPPKDLVIVPLAIDPIVLPDVEIPRRPVPSGREPQ